MIQEGVPVFKLYRRLHHQFMQCVAKQMTNSATHPGQAGLLACLLESGSLSQSDLCRHLKVSGAAVAVSLRRLEKQGLITRAQNPKDLREKVLCLTPAGEKSAQDMHDAILKVQQKAIEGLTSEELEYLSNLLIRIGENMTAFRELPPEECSRPKVQGE